MTVQEMDVRTGGSYRYTHADENGSYVFFGGAHVVHPRLRVPPRLRGQHGLQRAPVSLRHRQPDPSARMA